MNISASINYNKLNNNQLLSIPINVEQTDFPFKGEVIFNNALDPYQKAFDAFQQMGYRIPEENVQPQPMNNSLENIQLKSKMQAYKYKSVNDNYEEVRGLAAKRGVADGRPHIAGISEVIDNIYTDYQQKYGELVKASMQYMQDMNTMASKLSRYMKAGEDGKINIRLEATLEDMDEIVSKYSGTSLAERSTQKLDLSIVNKDKIAELKGKLNDKEKKLAKEKINDKTGGLLGSIFSSISGNIKKLEKEISALEKEIEDLKGFKVVKEGISIGEYFGKWKPDFDNAKPLMEIKGTEQEYAFWEKKLQGQGFIVKRMNGALRIFPDLKPVKEIFYALNHSSLKWGDEGSDISPQEFQSLQSIVDSQKGAINSSQSRLLETFRQDNSHFGTLIQLLIQLYKDLQQYNNSYVNM
ncbi:hypothetical protein [Providencia sp. Je.9.19]|uniref:hypothetical protein n=2 Tax=unclassified Providencia TaxID=2633465 RepID=UPI003DA804D0